MDVLDDAYFSITDNTIDFDNDIVDIEKELEEMSQEELKSITIVIEKDKSLHREDRKRRLKIEESINEKIIEIGLKNIDDGKDYCLNCGEKFKFLINPRLSCKECCKGICNSCTYLITKDERICYLCYLKTSRDLKTGKWFAVMSKRNGRFRRNSTMVLVDSMRKLKKKNSISIAPISKPEGISERVSLSSNGSNDSIKHRPKYIRKESTPSTLKLDKIKVPNTVKERFIPNYLDSVDSGSINELDDLTIRETAPKPTEGNHHLNPSNLEGSKNMSVSTTSIYSETVDSFKSDITVSGEILFSVIYDDAYNSLNIYIDQCRNLAVADRSNRTTNPYIKTYLLPDKTKSSKHKSTHKNGNLNPIFKETLTYKETKENLKSRTLSVSVWHKRFMTFNYFLGEVHVPLTDIDLSDKEPMWYPLKDKMRFSNQPVNFIYKGELLIKLKYKPSTRKNGKGSLQVLIVEARNLESDGQTLNAYVKGYLLPDKSIKTKRKTPIQKSQPNIKWDSLLQFTEVALEDLKDRALELSVYNHRKLKTNEFLGGTRLNLGLGHLPWMDAQGNEKLIWENFLSNPNVYTDATLGLRANLEF